MKKREFSSIKGTMPNPNEIFCKDCAFRDKSVVKIGNKIIPCGITKIHCDIYVEPNNKPSNILFQDAPCNYYARDPRM